MMGANLRIMELIQAMRTPFLDSIFSVLTQLGFELILIPVVCMIYWCVKKPVGYRLCMSLLIGLFVCQMLKITFCVLRPWELDPVLYPVASAIEDATGFSFPSGHTTSAICVYGILAHEYKKGYIAASLAILCVAFSRIYLGVHTPLDIVGAIVAGFLSIAVSYAVLKLVEAKANLDWYVLIGGIFIFLLSIVYTQLRIRAYGDPELFMDSYKFVGGGIGFLAALFVEKRYIRFEDKAPVWKQIVKLVVGVLLVLLIYKGSKAPIIALFGMELGSFVRYFITIFFLIAVYPWIFMLIQRKSHSISSGNCSQ